jgi:pectinesterase
VQDVRRDNAPSEPNEHFRWGHRVFFHDSHREGGDVPWHADNLQQAAGSPRPQDITPSWTFGGLWNPERTDAPRVIAVRIGSPERVVEVQFSEPVTVGGNPVLVTRQRKQLWWTGMNGTDTLTFALLEPNDAPASIDLGDGLIFASLATTQTRSANLKLP